MRQHIHPSDQGRVQDGTLIAGGEGWMGQKDSTLPKGQTAGSLGSVIFIPPGKASFPHPQCAFNGEKGAFPAFKCCQQLDTCRCRPERSLPEGETLVRLK